MVVEIIPRDGDPVRAPDDVDLSVVFIRSFGDVGGEFVVVDPDPGGVADGDAVVVEDIRDLEVADYHVGGVYDV